MTIRVRAAGATRDIAFHIFLRGLRSSLSLRMDLVKYHCEHAEI